MQSFFEWFDAQPMRAKDPWLILGKGPTFAKRVSFDLSKFHTIGLNHVVREQPVVLAHAIDLEVVETCGEDIVKNARFLAMPWFPHVRVRPFPWSDRVRFYPSDFDLEEWSRRIPALGELRETGRLLWYNLATSRRAPRPGCPLVHAYGFSSTVALNLLAQSGVRVVCSLGVDGGKTYSADFQDLTKKTLLAAGQNSYDTQFEGIAETIRRGRISFVPLDIGTPIRIFIRGAAEEPLAARVLEHSIRRRASISVEFVEIEAAAQFSIGVRALVREDVRVLQDLLRGAYPTPHELNSESWPALVELDRAASPWKDATAAFAKEWCAELLAALDGGAFDLAVVRAEVESGGVRASLVTQIARRLPDPMYLAPELIWSDRPARRDLQRWVAAVASHAWRKSPVKALADKFGLRDWSDPVALADLLVKVELRLGKRGWRGRGANWRRNA